MNYLKLIRYQNLLMLALMQLIFRYGFLELQNIPLALADWQYGILVLATVCIAAGGYIINNIFDVSTTGTMTMNDFKNNYWDKYEGYDLDKDKIGDVPFYPLSLYAVLVENNPSVMLLFRTFFVDLLDKTEKIIPSLTPENFVDEHPLMRKVAI